MVSTTRSRAARERQSSTMVTMMPADCSGSEKGKEPREKKGKGGASSNSHSSSTSSAMASAITEPAQSSRSSSPKPSCSCNHFDSSTASRATPVFSSLLTPRDDHGYNYRDAVDEIIDVMAVPPIGLKTINGRGNELSSESEEESHPSETSPLIDGPIKWCKTNRGNDRVCINGHTYDFFSTSVKNNQKSFRCTRKNNGCRAIVYIALDSGAYKSSNQVQHNHPPNPDDVKRLLIIHQIKERVSIEQTSVTRIIEDEYARSDLSESQQGKFLLPTAQGRGDIRAGVARHSDSILFGRLALIHCPLYSSLAILQDACENHASQSEVSGL